MVSMRYDDKASVAQTADFAVCGSSRGVRANASWRETKRGAYVRV